METKRLVFEKHGEDTTKVKCVIDNTLSDVTFLKHDKEEVCGEENSISMEDADEFISNCIWQLKHDFNTDNFNDDDVCKLKEYLFKEIEKFVDCEDKFNSDELWHKRVTLTQAEEILTKHYGTKITIEMADEQNAPDYTFYYYDESGEIDGTIYALPTREIRTSIVYLITEIDY